MIQKNSKLKRGGTLHKGVLVVLIIFIGFLAISNWRLYQRRVELRAQITEVQKEIDAQKQKNQELVQGSSDLTNQEYLEKIAREKLGLKKPGEQVVVVVPPPQTQEQPASQEKTFWQKVLDLLKF